MSKSQFVGVIPFNDNLMLSKKIYRHVPTYIHVHLAYIVFTRLMSSVWYCLYELIKHGCS